ncbi:ankyrin repeat domain-containing protein 31-like isoform X2 [Trachinotus anak]|uniref:ankyrin repeat domain-containing protein 31-like isoform X2 n=1 Tax=Trachinotus anak TaxID=443729 RepID=UPI0039F25C1B
MTDSCNQEHQGNGDVSASDDDSLSLLHGLNVCEIRVAAGDMERNDPGSLVGDKEQEVKMEINPVKPPEGGTSSSVQSASGPAESAVQPENVSTCVKIPKKKYLHKRNEKGETVLHKACKRKDLAQVMALVQAGISVNMEDYAGWTALHEASAAGDEAVVEELLKAGAHVNARSCDSVTPLHDAVSSGHYQVVKLLLQCGSSVSDLSGLDLTKEEKIKELLLTSQTSPGHEQPGGTPVQYRLPEAQCQSSFSLSRSDRVWSKESGDRDRAIQLRRKHSNDAVAVAMEEVVRNQADMLTWPLTGLKDTGRYHAALTQIQSVLTELLFRQHLEKDHLSQRYRSVSDSLQRRVLKSQLVSLASCQRNLVEILQKQMHLAEVYVSVRAKLSNQPSSHGSSAAERQQPDHFSTPAPSEPVDEHSFNQDRQRKGGQRPVIPSRSESHRPVTPSRSEGHRPVTPSRSEGHRPVIPVRSESHRPVTPIRSEGHRPVTPSRLATPNNTKDRTVPRPLPPSLTQGMKTPSLKKRTSSCQSSASQPGNTVQHINFQMKVKNALIQTQAEDNSRHLSKLILRGVLAPGSTLQLLLKGHWHLAHVLSDGSLKDSRGKLHLAPERWLESILGNNIPVSSAYAWDKVTFRDEPLSQYLLNMEAEGHLAQTQPEDDVELCRVKALAAEAALNHLMRIKIIHLVDEEELLPTAVMDGHWETLFKKGSSESEDWSSELI